MDLSYSAEYEAFRGEVKAFLAGAWPLRGDEAKLPGDKRAALFRERAIAAGFLARAIPKKYGGSEQSADVLEGADHPRGVRARARAGRDGRHRPEHARADAAREGQRVAEGEVHRADHPR